MKNGLLKISTIILALGSSLSVYADNVSFIPAQTPGFSMSLTGLYLQPSASNLGYAVYTTPLPLQAPNWKQETVKPSYSGAFDLGLQYTLMNSTDQIKFDWLHFSNDDSAAAYSTPDTSVGPPFYYGPAEQFLLDTGANSTVKFKIDNANLVFGHLINLSDHIQLEPFVGLDAVYLKENITNNYWGTDPVYGPYTHTVYETSTFTGVGPRIGFDSSYFVTNYFAITAEMAGGLLAGPENSKTSFTSWTSYVGEAPHNNVPTDTSMADQSQTQIVPETDAKIAMLYKFPLNKLGSAVTLQVGYLYQIYMNVINQEVPSTLVPGAWEAGTVAIINQAQQQSNLSVKGPFASITLQL